MTWEADPGRQSGVDAVRARATDNLLLPPAPDWWQSTAGPDAVAPAWLQDRLLDAARHPVIAVDPHRVIIYWNTAAEELFGWSAAEALGRCSTELLHRMETPGMTAEIISAMACGAMWTGDYEVTRRSGDTVSVQVTNQPVFDRWGDLVAVVGTAVDLTLDNAQAAARREALRVIQDRYDAIVEHSTDVIMLFRTDFTIEWVSPGTQRIFGADPDEMVGRSGLDLIHPDDLDQCFQDYLSIPNLGDQVRSEFRYIDPRGELHWVEELATNLVDDPRVGFTVANLRDITERKQMAAELELQARMLQSVGQAVVGADTDRRVIFWNQAATDLYGWTQAEALGQPISEILVPAAGWEGRASEVMASVIGGNAWSGGFEICHKDGTSIPILSTTTPVYDDGGQPIAWIGVSSDQSDRIELDETQARLSAIVASSTDAIISTSLDGIVTSWNGAATTLFGHRAEDILGRSIGGIVPTDRVSDVFAALDRIRAGGLGGTTEVLQHDASGTGRVVSLSISPVRSSDGTVIAASAIARDISERAALLAQVEGDRRRMHDAQRSAQLGSFDIDITSGQRSWSDELFRIFGLPPGDVPELVDVADQVHTDDRAIYDEFRDGFLRAEDVAACTVRIVRPDGEVRWVELRSSPRRAGSNSLGGTVLDVTDRAEAQAQLEHRAHHDPLTGIPNRTLMSEILDRALADQARTGDGVAVAFLDLDQFKVINDSLGHGVGDQILRAVADRLRHLVAEEDIVGRFGGDEFIVIRTGCSGPDLAIQFADQVRHILDEQMTVEGCEFALNASVGVALSRPGDTPATVLRDADTAMYSAKARGRGRSELFDDALRQRTQEKLTIALELRAALEGDQLRLVYQPIVSLAAAEVVGFEALIRWDHPTRGELSPAVFIPSAEESGLIVEIGHWALGEALAQLSAWRLAEPAAHDLFVSVNVSAKELSHPGLLGATEATLNASDVPPGLVHLEITESAVMENVDHSIETAQSLRNLGLHLSIDDFGTGYSSLSYLKELPVNTLKIDRSFVSGLGHDLQDRSIARAIIAMAKALDLDVVAEGVETSAQAATLAQLGCGLAQGYLWSRPVPSDQALALLRRNLTESLT